MKTLQLTMIAIFTACITFLMIPHDAYASTCAYRETIYSAPQFFLLSDNVFVGTVTSISNYSDHQWQVHFDIEKIWKGVATRQTSTVMTNTLQACGYSIYVGEKYLVYTSGSPYFINTIFTRMYADAQNDIALFDDPKFQAEEKTKEELNKKLKIAQGRVESMMIDKRSHIPVNGVGVDEVNSTLDINIDNTKTSLSADEYGKRLHDILGDIPIKVTFGQYTAVAPLIHIGKSSEGDADTYLIHDTNSTSVSQSPLKQFKSGTDFDDISCKEGFALVAKAENNHPSCIKVTNISKLVSRGWASNSVNKLVIHGLRNVYQTHEKIDATIIFHGFINGCDLPHMAVLDSNQNIVWKSKSVFSSCISVSRPLSYVNQKIDLNSGFGEPLIINQTGNYKLTVSYYNMTSEREFNTVSYLR